MLDERKVPVEPRDRCPNFYEMPIPDGPVPGVPSILPAQQNIALPFSNALRGIIASRRGNQSLSTQHILTNQNLHTVIQRNAANLYQANLQHPHASQNTLQSNMSVDAVAAFPSVSALSIALSQQQHQSNVSELAHCLFQQHRNREQIHAISWPSLSAHSHQSLESGSASLFAASPDPLINMLTNILRPRVQITGPPRTNAELIDLLINEMNATLSQATNAGFEQWNEANTRLSSHPRTNRALIAHALSNPSNCEAISQADSRGQDGSDRENQMTVSPTDQHSHQSPAAASSSGDAAVQITNATAMQHDKNSSPAHNGCVGKHSGTQKDDDRE